LQNPEAQKFLIWENNFLKQNNQHRVMQNREFCKSGKKTRYTKRKTQWNLCRSKHKYELKLKIKSTKGSKPQQIQIKHLYQKQETNKPKKVQLGFDDIFGRNMTRQNTYRFRN